MCVIIIVGITSHLLACVLIGILGRTSISIMPLTLSSAQMERESKLHFVKPWAYRLKKRVCNRIPSKIQTEPKISNSAYSDQ